MTKKNHFGHVDEIFMEKNISPVCTKLSLSSGTFDLHNKLESLQMLHWLSTKSYWKHHDKLPKDYSGNVHKDWIKVYNQCDIGCR